MGEVIRVPRFHHAPQMLQAEYAGDAVNVVRLPEAVITSAKLRTKLRMETPPRPLIERRENPDSGG